MDDEWRYYERPLVDYLASKHGIKLSHHDRGWFAIYLSFDNALFFEISPHMIINFIEVEIRYRYRTDPPMGYPHPQMQVIAHHYLKKDSATYYAHFNAYAILIKRYQERDTSLRAVILQKVTVLFFVLRRRGMDKDSARMVAQLSRAALIRWAEDVSQERLPDHGLFQ